MLSIISKKTIPTEQLLYYVIEAPKSLYKQSNYDSKRLQKDGWGIAYYEKNKLNVYKSHKPVYKEKTILEKKLKNIKANIFMMHIRKAANPNKLPVKKIISYNNSQPFSYNNIAFMHNGCLCILNEIKSNLGKYTKLIKGFNDSEVLFCNFLKHLYAYEDISTALEMTRDEINTVWVSVKGKYPELKSPYKGLNIFLSDGNKFYFLSDYITTSNSIMTPNWNYGTYSILKDKDKIIISSEPLDNSKNWMKLKHSNIYEIDKNLKSKAISI